MTSKTFKSITNAGTTLRVRGIGDAGVELLHHNDRRTFGSVIASSDVPALALAVLEAAGVQPTDPASKQVRFGTPEHLGHIAFELKRYAECEAKATAEAEAQAELEAEALELFQASRLNGETLPSFDGYPDIKLQWLAVARRAREMRAEK